MDKSNLLKALDENGMFAEYDDLYREDVTVRDWVSRNEDLVRSNRAIAQAVQADAPHDVKEGYFKDKDEKRQYEAGEKKYNEERDKKQQLADEYQRAKDIQDFSEFSLFDKSFGQNLAAIGMKSANEYAKQQAIKGNKAKALANEVAAKLGFISDFTPPPFSYAGPAIRYVQRGLNEDTWDPTDVEVLADVGTSVFGPAKGAAKTGYRALKEVAGSKVGKVFDTRFGKWIERGVNAVDAKTAQKALKAERKAISNKIDDFIDAYNNGTIDDEIITNFATEVADRYPELATKLIDRTNALAKSRRTVQEAELAAKFKSKDATKREAKSILAERKSAEADNALSDKLFETQKKAQDEYLYGGKPLFDAEKRLVRENADLLQAQKLANEAKGSVVAGQIAKAVAKPVIKKVTRAYPDSKERDFDKEYSSALEYIIQSNKRQWNAGFKPHGGIELEAWQIAKDRGEI